MKSNIVFIGMMGTAKSTCGKQLADRLDMLFLDVDALIEYEEMPISEMFKTYGEKHFRDLESKMIKRISSYENLIIATGGGVVLRPENMLALKDSSYIILLKAAPKVILERVKKQKGKRPLLKNPKLADIERIMLERKPLYEKYADIVIDNSFLTIEQTVDKVETELYKYMQIQIKKD